MTDTLTHRQISRVTPNGNSNAGLRVSSSALKDLGWNVGTLVHWRVVNGVLEGHRVILKEDR